MYYNPTSDLGYMHPESVFDLYVSTFNRQPSYADISRFRYVMAFGF